MTEKTNRGRRYAQPSPNHLILIFIVWALLALPVPALADFYANTLPLMQAKFDSITDYRCLYNAYSAANGKTTDVTFRYYFLKPKQIRMETLTGRYPGTVLLYNPQKKPDKVKVRVGNPVLAVMQKAIYGDYFHHRDKRVTDLGGFGVLESDWGWFIDIHREMARFGRTEVKKDVVFAGKPALYYRLVSTNPEKTLSVAQEELWIDKSTYAPMKFIEYDRYGTVIRKVEYKDMVVDVGLKGELFTHFEAANHHDNP
jgi:outer membrane lipoprotein-sorting protein